MDVAFSGRGICLACVKALSQSLHKKKKKKLSQGIFIPVIPAVGEWR